MVEDVRAREFCNDFCEPILPTALAKDFAGGFSMTGAGRKVVAVV
jgi:hypothetical protein